MRFLQQRLQQAQQLQRSTATTKASEASPTSASTATTKASEASSTATSAASSALSSATAAATHQLMLTKAIGSSNICNERAATFCNKGSSSVSIVCMQQQQAEEQFQLRPHDTTAEKLNDKLAVSGGFNKNSN